MKMTIRLLVVTMVIVLCLVASSAVAFAGGMPAAHGVDGQTFGGAVSGLAQTDPGALAAHVSGNNVGGGLPAAHGVDGQTFGGLVSGLAQTNPGALAAHVSGR